MSSFVAEIPSRRADVGIGPYGWVRHIREPIGAARRVVALYGVVRRVREAAPYNS